MLLDSGCSYLKLSDGTEVFVLDISSVPGTPDGEPGFGFALSWNDAQVAPVDIDLVPDSNILNSGSLVVVTADGGGRAVATASGVVHLDVPPAVGSWVTGYLDTPVQ